MNDIVVGINRSSTAARAVATAAEMARALGVNLHLVMCADKSKAVELKVRSDEYYADWRSEAEQFLQDAALELDHDQVTHAVGVGSPAVMLCEEAHRLRARTIVVGNRRVQGASRVLGSIAGEVVKNAECDVLIVNTTG